VHIDHGDHRDRAPSSPELKSADFFTEMTQNSKVSSAPSLARLKPKENDHKPAELGSTSLSTSTSGPKKATGLGAKKPVSLVCLFCCRNTAKGYFASGFLFS